MRRLEARSPLHSQWVAKQAGRRGGATHEEFVLEGRRYRLHPTAEQADEMNQWFGALRALWNVALEHRQIMWRQWRRPVGFGDQCRELTAWRHEEDWVGAVSQSAQQQVLRDLDRAFQNWWGGTHRAPTFRARQAAASLRLPAKECGAPEKLNRKWGQVRVPKLGRVRFRQTRALGGDVRSVTIKRDSGGRWWVIFLVDTKIAPAARRAGPTIGVDLGVAVSVAVSDGRTFQAPTPGSGEAQRRRRLERRLARQTRGSSNREQTRQQLARVRSRDAGRRSDWAHKTANALVAEGGLVGFEDLDVAKMTRSAAGTNEQPGINVAAKSGLNRAILASGWGQVRDYATWKADRTGALVVRVPAAFTSQRCSACGHVARGNRESQAVFRCHSCGHEGNADLNAAINISTAAGHAVAACGDLGTARSKKHEPPIAASA
jgi:transposase